MASSGEDNSSADEKENRRGINIVQLARKARTTGIRLPVAWNNRNQPIKPHKSIFVRYIGMTARASIPITYHHWKEVPSEMKNELLADVKSSFDIVDQRQKYVLQVADNLLRNFRTKMRK